MRGDPETPFPFPPDGDAFAPFPETVPWDAPIWTLPWWLVIKCDCGGGANYPLRLLSARIGWRHTLREVVPMLSCKLCKKRPTSVVLVDYPAGDVGRHGAKEKRLRLC